MYTTDHELLEIVDYNDRVIGTATRGEIHRRGLMHRAVHIFVFNRAGDIYVQLRSAAKDRHPLKLDSSAAGHVDPGESYETAAIRELEEELGIKAQLENVLSVKACALTDNEHVVLFMLSTDAEPIPDPDEIVWGKFMTRDHLTELMDQTPEEFVPVFIYLWREFLRSRG